MKELPKIIVPVQEINVQDRWDEIDDLLEKLQIPSEYRETLREGILEHQKCNLIIALLTELTDMIGLRMDYENTHKILSITRDLKKIDSPAIPNSIPVELKHSMRWEDWTVWDIEREYLEIYVLRREKPPIMPKTKYLKREVLVMLNMLLDCDVIYNFKRTDLFVNNIKGELESYFRNHKRIMVEVL